MIDQQKVLKIKEKLDELSDELTKRIIQWEAKFQAYQFGVICSVKFSKESQLTLSYNKRFDNKWQLTIATTEPEDNEWILRDAPRGLRLYALKRMEQFEEELIKTAESMTLRIEKYLKGEIEDDSN